VVTFGPFKQRIVDSGTGYVVSYYTTSLPEGEPTLIYVAKREWVKANPSAAKAFQQSVVEGAAYVLDPKNDAAVRALAIKYLKVPPANAATMQISMPGPIVTEQHLNWWIDMMKDQGMLKTNINVGQLIVK
jgi:NitT/TauT family transport system substrate-binding protein